MNFVEDSLKTKSSEIPREKSYFSIGWIFLFFIVFIILFIVTVSIFVGNTSETGAIQKVSDTINQTGEIGAMDKTSHSVIFFHHCLGFL